MAFKIERIDNYIIITNTLRGNESEYPYDSTAYTSVDGLITVYSLGNSKAAIEADWTDFVDKDSNSFASQSDLINWLRINTGITVNFNYDLEVASGNITNTSLFEKYGRNNNIDIVSTPEDIWTGADIYTGFPTGSAETMEIFSSSVNDTAAGTGARTVTIYNLQDSDGNSMPNVDVTLNGTTPVSLGGQVYYRGGTRIKVRTAGTLGYNDGELTLRHATTTANIFAVMPIQRNQTAIAAYTVPKGCTLYINRVNFQLSRSNGSNGSASMTFRARPFGGVFNAPISPEVTNGVMYLYNAGYFVFDERTDIKCTAESVSDNNTIITAEFGGLLIKN